METTKTEKPRRYRPNQRMECKCGESWMNRKLGHLYCPGCGRYMGYQPNIYDQNDKPPQRNRNYTL
jgi:hypothetical protein